MNWFIWYMVANATLMSGRLYYLQKFNPEKWKERGKALKELQEKWGWSDRKTILSVTVAGLLVAIPAAITARVKKLIKGDK